MYSSSGKIIHLCLASFYIDGGSYQENILPRYHKKLGYEVEVLASPDIFNENGCLIIGRAPVDYVNEDGIRVARLKYKFDYVDKKLKRFKGVYDHLVNSRPGIIFVHGCQFLDIFEVIRYLKCNPNVKVYVDNHADFSNSARNYLSKNLLHRIIWRICAQSISPYVAKFFGVMPSRVQFLCNMYKIPDNMVELLVMGADDELLVKGIGRGQSVRRRFNIGANDFLLITGGKIDASKREVLVLMKAVNELKEFRVKLLIFGSVIDELKEDFYSLLSPSIIYMGWIRSEDSYACFDAADLVIFPGRHSVFWEQVVAQKKPLMVKKWDGATHIDIGGNVIFLEYSNLIEIKSQLLLLLRDHDLFNAVKVAASSNESSQFLYSRIARKSLQISD